MRGEVHELDEVVGLAPQFVGHHRRLRLDGADHGDPHALPLHGVDQPAEIAVPREEEDVIHLVGHLHGIDDQVDVDAALGLTAALGIGEFLDRLGHHCVTVIVKPVDQGTDRRVFLVFDERRVVERPDHASFLREQIQKPFVIDVETERPCGRV